MATPRSVSAGLAVVTSAAVNDAQVVATAAVRTGSPAGVRAALFAATPLIVGDYIDGSAALALDWYEEIRDAARPPHRFTPVPLAVVNDGDIAAAVAKATTPLHELELDPSKATDLLLRQATSDSFANLEQVIQKDVAGGFWDTIVGNSNSDPDARGWRRYAQSGACKFCVMLADRGAVFRQGTANFAAHGACHCTCGPSYDPSAPEASVMQYVASSKTRTSAEQAQLREYLNANYPDAPG